MSGGSYDYLSLKEQPPNDLLERMAKRLHDLRYADLARVTRGVRQPEAGPRIRRAWRLVEMYDSSEIDLATLTTELDKLKEE